MSQILQDFYGQSAYRSLTNNSAPEGGGDWVHFRWPDLASEVGGDSGSVTPTQLIATHLVWLHHRLKTTNAIEDATSVIAVDGEMVKSQTVRDEINQLAYSVTFIIFRPDPTDFDPDLIN